MQDPKSTFESHFEYKSLYDRTAVEQLTEAAIANPFNIGQTIARFKPGHPIIANYRTKYPEYEKNVGENFENNPHKFCSQPCTLDRLQQKSCETEVNRYYSENSGWKKEISKMQAGKSYAFPIDSSQWNYYDEKIPVEEAETPYYEHAEFVERHLGELKNLGQVFFFFEGIGQGLSKNPYLTLNEKLDEIARYVQYLVFKQEMVIGTGLLDEAKFEILKNCSYTHRRITHDHWTREGWNPRHLWREEEWNLEADRPEYFYLTLPNEDEFLKLKLIFKDNLEKITEVAESNEITGPLKPNSGIKVKLSSFAKSNLEDINKFDFSKVNFVQENYSQDYMVDKPFIQTYKHKNYADNDPERIREDRREFTRFMQQKFGNKFRRKKWAKKGTLVN